MFITFFCKRDKHADCPIKWPVNEACGPDEDCSFDMKMVDCECKCHQEKNQAIVEVEQPASIALSPSTSEGSKVND